MVRVDSDPGRPGATFDARYYLENNPDVAAAGIDPYEHFVHQGRAEGRLGARPELGQAFDVQHYLESNPDVAAAGVDPYEHFLSHGRAEGRLGVSPTMSKSSDTQHLHGVNRGIASAVLDAQTKGREPFDEAYYLTAYPDIAAAGVDPYEHFVTQGKAEGRLGVPPEARSSGDLAGSVKESFDAQYYLENYPDIAAAGVDPYEHFVMQGRAEGRQGKPPEIAFSGDFASLDPTRETVLIVSHEASRTGAPILSLNIARHFNKKYNVISLLLDDGDIVGDFEKASNIVVSHAAKSRTIAAASNVINQLVARQSIHFAIVNSIESRSVLEALAQHFIPTITLIHEFAAYTRPRSAFRDVLTWSADTVFSAPVILQDATSSYPDIANAITHILPQGRCELPDVVLDQARHQADAKRLVRAMRPANNKNCVVVLGAGYVQLRKGVDLFIACATEVMKASEGDHVHFVWIGKGYDPERDMGYSVYLADQVKRAGLSRHVSFIGETSNIEVAYAEADVMLISSRLDPLPNVAIDAMAHGLPVVCFDRTTGIADVLKANGLEDECVAPYLDVSAMAERTLALIHSSELRQAVGERSRLIVKEQFAMEHYVSELESLAKAAMVRQKAERNDFEEILHSALPDLEFVRPPYQGGLSKDRAVRNYVRAWASEILERKPFSGFHPGVYRDHAGLSVGHGDPLAHYIRAGQPKGDWNYEVIGPDTPPIPLPVGARVALHLHVYYADLLPELLSSLNRNEVRPDLLISVPSAQVEAVRQIVATYEGRVAELQVVPNVGRDIGPLLTAFGATLLRDYDVVGHLHTKKTVDLADSETGTNWRRFLLANLLGDQAPMADIILGRMLADPSIGMVFPDDPYAVRWGANLPYAEELMPRLGLDRLPNHFVFPIGTMFWARTEALRPFVQLGLDWDDYPSEPLPYDGSLLHAIERLFGVRVNAGPFRLVATHVPGFAR